MGFLEKHRPVVAMLALQLIYAFMTFSSKAALAQGMNPRVFVLYRQAIATLIVAPLAYFVHRRQRKSNFGLGIKGFCMILIASIVGVTINQNFYFKGLYLSSSATASAIINLVPAITFVMAASIGLEKLGLGSPRSLAKIFGTVFCVGGTVLIAFFKGPAIGKILQLGSWRESPGFNLELIGGENWIMGCLFLLASCCCWSFWMILQVPLSAIYPKHLSITAWMCFLATLQSAIVAVFLEPDPKVWKLSSGFQVFSCLYSGIMGSGVAFYVQTWCISKRGPLFTAMFSPLCTVLVTILGCTLLHEELYIGSVAGAVLVVGGLYVVLWGKARDSDVERAVGPTIDYMKMEFSNDEILQKCSNNLKKPLLAAKLHCTNEIEVNK